GEQGNVPGWPPILALLPLLPYLPYSPILPSEETDMHRLADRLDLTNRAVGTVSMWLALAMVQLQCRIVLPPYDLGLSYIFLGEGVIYLHAALFMLGAGYTLWAGGHVRVDIFYANLSPRGRAAIDIFGHLALLAPSLIVLLIYSWPMVTRSWAILEGPISV